MQQEYDITDKELEIMQILWERKQCGLNEILERLSIDGEKNKNTTKTLIHRLTLKGAIESKKINGKEVVYIPKISEKKFLSKESKNFLKKFFNGNMQKLLLNFIEDKKVSEEELEKLIDIMKNNKE